MEEQFVVTILNVLVLVSLGVLLAGALAPIQWRFPNWSRQVLMNKIAGTVVIVGALALALGKWIGFGL